MKVNVAAIIPALNEEGSIGQVVAAVPRDVVSQVIVVDNGSTDRTAEVARAAGAVVIPQPERGYGAACHAGLMASAGADLLVFLDGDRSDVPEETPLVLAPIFHGKADLVIGSRLSGRREPGAMPPHALFGNWLASKVLGTLYRVQITDLGSFRAIHRKALIELGMQERVHFNPKGFPLEELPRQLRSMDLGVVGNRRSVASDLMLPVKLMEYISLGIPVVAPRLRTIAHYFTDDMVAFYEPEDIQSFGDSIFRLWQKPELRRRQAEQAGRFMKEYGWDRQGPELVAFYRNLMGNHNT